MPILGIIASSFATGGDYESIATVVVGGGGVSTITFSSIPATYKHLQIRAIAKAHPTAADAAYDLITKINNDSTYGNYTGHYLVGNGAAANAGANNGLAILGVSTGSSIASVFGVMIIDILDYANTNNNKTLKSLLGYELNGSGGIIQESLSWMNTAAINRLDFIFRTGPTFAQYSHFALYGIKG